MTVTHLGIRRPTLTNKYQLSTHRVLWPTLIRNLRMAFCHFNATQRHSISPSTRFREHAAHSVTPRVKQSLGHRHSVTHARPAVGLIVANRQQLFSGMAKAKRVRHPHLTASNLITVRRHGTRIFRVRASTMARCRRRSRHSRRHRHQACQVTSRFRHFTTTMTGRATRTGSLAQHINNIICRKQHFNFITLPYHFLRVNSGYLFRANNSTFLGRFLQYATNGRFSNIRR